MLLVNKEQAFALKELGYELDGEYHFCYIGGSDEPIVAGTPIGLRKMVAPAPDYFQVWEWLEDGGILVWIEPKKSEEKVVYLPHVDFSDERENSGWNFPEFHDKSTACATVLQAIVVYLKMLAL